MQGNGIDTVRVTVKDGGVGTKKAHSDVQPIEYFSHPAPNTANGLNLRLFAEYLAQGTLKQQESVMALISTLRER